MTRKTTQNLIVYLILAVGAVLVISPFIWMLSTSLKDIKEVYKFPPVLIPALPQWENYLEVWQVAKFPRYFLNSFIVAISITIGMLFTSSTAAFAFARMKFRGKNVLFYLVLGTMMIPSEILLIPNYVIMSRLDWTNKYQALILPFLAGAMGIFILRQHFLTIPQDLEDAARIDGCGRFGFLVRILLPNSKPAIAAVTVFTFINAWNSYIWPLIVTRDDEMRTIQVGLAAFKDAQSSGANTDWALLMAASTIAIIPILIIYSFAEKWFTEGFTTSGIRG